MVGGKIPAIIHQMWLAKDPKDATIEGPPSSKPKYLEYTKGLRDLNPKWKYMWWNGAAIESQIWSHPQLARFKETYDSMLLHIMKCDLARYAILWLHGGAYFDLDTKFHRPIPVKWLEDASLHLFQEPAYQSGGRAKSLYPFTGYSGIISNQPIICAPKHPLMWTLLEEAEARCRALAASNFFYRQGQVNFNPGGLVIDTTGPQMLTEVILQNKQYIPYVKSPSWFFGTDTDGNEIKCDMAHAGSPECRSDGSFCPPDELAEAIGSNNWSEGTGWNNEHKVRNWCIVILIVAVILAIIGAVYYSRAGPKSYAGKWSLVVVFVLFLFAIGLFILWNNRKS